MTDEKDCKCTKPEFDPKKEEFQRKKEQEVYDKLREPFDLSCYSIDSSRGFDLASLRAQYISIRLNEVLGFSNWFFSGRFEKSENGILYFGMLTIVVNGQAVTRQAVGFGGSKKNDGDSYKSAMTDCFSKAASYFGIAEQAFCGLVNCDEIKKLKNNPTKPTFKPKETKTEEVKKAPSFVKKNKKQTEPKEEPITETKGW